MKGKIDRHLHRETEEGLSYGYSWRFPRSTVTPYASQNNLCITSFNSTGFGLAAQKYIETLLLFSNILCLQEHFLLDAKDKKSSNTDKLRNKFKNHDMFIVPAHKDNNQVTRGRGKGGLATIWDRKLTNYVSKVKTENFRLQATKFNLPSGPLLIINTYFPCDPRTDNFDDRELLTLLSDIQNTVLQSDCNRVWLAGDLNSHFQRQTRFTNLVKEYFEETRLYILWENPDHLDIIPLIDYTYLSSAGGVHVRSTIDHFACSRSILPIITHHGSWCYT